MDPIDVQTIQELETLRTLWKLCIWFMGITLPTAGSLIVFFYNKYDNTKDRYVQKLENEIEILKAKK